MASLFNIELEQEVISIVLQKPETYSDIEFLEQSDFSRDLGTIWEIIRLTIQNKGVPTPIILAEKINSIGIKFNGIEVFDYLNALLVRPSDKRAIVDLAKKLKKKTLVRKIVENAQKLAKEAVEAERDGKSGAEIISLTDKYLGDSIINLAEGEREPANIYEGIVEMVEEKGNNPQEVVGYRIPFPLFEKYYGGPVGGNIYWISARSGIGKSTFLMFLLDSVVNDLNSDVKGLYLDTEMSPEEQQIRLVANKIGVPHYYIDSGMWRKHPEYFPKVREGLKMFSNTNRKLWFEKVNHLNASELRICIKKWYYKNCGRGSKAFVVLDYLKPTMADFKEFKGDAEWEMILKKMQIIKDTADELNIPIWTAIQSNRSGVTKGKTMDTIDDSENTFGMSGRLDWLTSFSGILRKKLPDEIAMHGGLQYGTHSLIPLKGRKQGAQTTGFNNYVKVMRGKEVKYEDNYFCYNIDNFNVKEVCDYKQIAENNGWSAIKRDKVEDTSTIL
jgi:replicative DNA helicase